MKNIVKITQDQLKEMLLNWNFGSQPISLQYITDPNFISVVAKRQFFPSVKKIANVGGMLGYSYQKSVNNQLIREGKEDSFLAQSLWNGKGKRLNNCISTHIDKGTFYLTLKHQQTFRSFYFDFDNFKTIAKEHIKDYLKPFIPPQNQKVNEGNEIFHREISLDNILKIKLRKTTYIVIR